MRATLTNSVWLSLGAAWLAPLVASGADPDPRLNPAIQFQARQEALQRAKQESEGRTFSFDWIKQRYEARDQALKQVLASAKARRAAVDRLINQARDRLEAREQAKTRALAEARVIARLNQDRRQAEDRAVALLLQKLEARDPNYLDNALRRAKDSAEGGPGQPVSDLMNLQDLEGALPMSYQRYLPAGLDAAGNSPAFAKSLNPGHDANHAHGTHLSPQVSDVQSEIQREVAKRAALNKVLEASRQQRANINQQIGKPVEDQLRELLDEYRAGKISATEYNRKRALIRANN